MSEEVAYRNLANAIVEQAVKDWRKLCKGKEIPKESFDSIRYFFNSDWGKLLCGKVDPQYMLRRLEEELKAVD